MRPLPASYRTATPDGRVIVIYRGGERVGEVKARAGARQQDLVALEDEAASFAEQHAAQVEAAATKRTPSTSGDAGTAPRTPRSGGGKRSTPSTSGDAGTE